MDEAAESRSETVNRSLDYDEEEEIGLYIFWEAYSFFYFQIVHEF